MEPLSTSYEVLKLDLQRRVALKAIILAAGEGKRMGDLTKDVPKCLLEIAPTMSSLSLQLSALHQCRFKKEDVTIVVGHESEKIRKQFHGYNYVYSTWYKEFNTLYSLSQCRWGMDDGFLLMNADVVMKNMSDYIHSLITLKSRSAAIVCSAYDEESVKFLSSAKSSFLPSIAKIGKKISDPEGEFTGVIYFSPLVGVAMARALEVLRGEYYWKDYFESAVQWVIDRGAEISPRLFANDSDWVEIDTPEDLEKARKMFSGQ